MKILGEKSLSSKVIIGLDILFAIISIINILILGIIVKIISHIIMIENIMNNIIDLTMYIMIIITGMIAIFIIYQFRRIFIKLKENELFCKENSERLKKVGNSCFIISTLYFIIAMFLIMIIKDLYYIFAFSLMLAIIFAVSGIGIKILNEIYKKAIEYKEENDFTI